MAYDVAAALDALDERVMTFDVAFSSHELARQGITDARVVRVAVCAADHKSGVYQAAQKAAAQLDQWGEETLIPWATYPVT